MLSYGKLSSNKTGQFTVYLASDCQ
uniref:Uncharacterized protein n=1 Tax=Rhizophora mucronata TaxID=61149 RepID=A0A2P2R1E2_RHIMU